jgi:hypothetical protein
MTFMVGIGGLFGGEDDSESPRDYYTPCTFDECGYCGNCEYYGFVHFISRAALGPVPVQSVRALPLFTSEYGRGSFMGPNLTWSISLAAP